MLPEHRGLLAGLFSRFRRHPFKGRQVGGRPANLGRLAHVEQLEERRLLVSRVFLDFGNGFAVPTSGPYAGFNVIQGNTPDTLHDAFVGTGQAGNVVYNEGIGILENGLTVTPPYDLVGTAAVLNSSLNSTPVNIDALTLEESITAQIQRALEPFDIQVISSINSNFFNWPAAPATTFGYASAAEATNNLPTDGGSPVPGTANTPQFGSDDVYVVFAGIFSVPPSSQVAVQTPVPISASFSVQAPPTPGAKPDRLDTGAIIDTSYWINRVLGPGGTGGSLNVAMANAAMYAIGWGYGLPEVENGTAGPFTNFIDPNVQLLDQSNAMVEGGFYETVSGEPTISDTNAASFTNFPMMQDGENLAPLLQPGVLGSAAILGTPDFPLPPEDTSFPLDGVFITATGVPGGNPFTFPDGLLNSDPSVTVNEYTQLINDPDIGPNPDVAYVTGTGGFDQIFITRMNSTQAQVTVNAYTDATYSTSISAAAAADGNSGVVSSYSYTINLAKIVTPGRASDNQPFKIIVDGTTSEDQIYLDPTLGVEVQVHGGADVKTLNITGNGTYNATYTPTAPPSNNGQGELAEIASLIPEGLVPGAGGTLVITGTTSNTVTTKVGKKLKTTTTTVPFTTTVLLDHFTLIPDLVTNDTSALRLQGFNKLSYVSPGFLDNDYNITNFTNPDGSLSWQIAGQVNSQFFAPSLAGNLQFQNISQLVIDTSKGSSNDTVSFATGDQTPDGLKNVDVIMGSQAFGSTDELDFDDSASALDQTYLISTTQLLPVQPANSLFTGFNYSGAELVTLDGTSGTDDFVVTPSKTTSYVINGTSGANTLAVHLAGTQYSETDDGVGDGQWTFSGTAAVARMPITFNNIQTIVNQGADYQLNPIPDNTSPLNASSQDSDIIALAGSSDSGVSKPLVQVYSAITNQLLYQFYAYEQTFKGGVHVTTADMNGDGVPDVIVAPGAGRAGEVKVFNGAVLQANATGPQLFVNDPVGVGALMADFTLLNPNLSVYQNGLYVAVGDVDGDGDQDIITSNARGASQINVFLNQGGGVFNSTPDVTFAPYPKTMTAGVVIAAGDIDGDGTAEIVTAPGVGQVALVKEFSFADVSLNPAAPPIRQFDGFETTFKGGVSLTMGDLDGDGLDEIILGAGTGGKSRVRVFDAGTGTMEREFQAYTTGNTNAPVKVLARNIDGSGAAELYTTQALSSTTHTVNLYDPLATVDPLATPLTAPLVDSLMESSSDLKAGINLG
jgi:hypothetical protein